MVSITHSWKNACRLDSHLAAARKGLRLWVAVCFAMFGALCLTLMPLTASAAEPTVELQNLKVEQSEGAVYASLQWNFQLPAPLEEALYKGVALYFVAEVEVTRERWYFYDKKLLSAQRHMRLSYLPLTRRWRVNVASQPFSSAGLGMSLGQSYDNLDDALQSIRRIAQWNIGNASDLEPETKQNISISYKLDLTQLPRPMQMGASGQSDWNIAWNKTQRLVLETNK
jgi:hypothetical protein